MDKNNGYTIKGLKTFRGMDTDGYNCTLYKDGKKVAFVIEEGSGGEPMFEFTSKQVEADLVAYVNTLPNIVTDLADHKDPTKKFEYKPDIASFVGGLVDEQRSIKQLKGWCRKLTVFKLDTTPENAYETVKHVFDPSVKKYLTDKYGSRLLKIYNEDPAIV